MRPSRGSHALLLALLLAAAPAPARAEGKAPSVAPPRVEGLALDGRPSEEAWAGAPALPAETTNGVTPVVKVLVSGGRLWVLCDVPETVGFPSGVRILVAPEGAKGVAEAASFSFAPQEIRAPRWVARGAKGSGRPHYPVEGAADLQGEGRWTAEVAVPLRALDLPSDAVPLLVAVAVSLRTPNTMAAAPAGSLLAGLETFARVAPPDGGWGAAAAPAPDAARIASEDDADRRRLDAWGRFVAAQRSGGVTRERAREVLLAPLDDAIAARPDLALLHVFRGNILRQLDDPEAARAAYARALAAVPHMPEVEWAVAEIDLRDWTERPDTEPSDYAAALARIAKEAASRPAGAPGPRLAEGILRYRMGEFAAARALLDPVVARWPVDETAASIARFAKEYEEAWAQELALRRRDAEKGDLPRVRVTTSKGAFVVELYEDDAPNTTANFVWLARAGFYDGTTFHRVVPFYIAQGGDPNSRTGRGRVGQGGPGWSVPTEPATRTRRRPFRGSLAMANAGKDTEGSQFFVTTGTAAHLEDFSVFGRVVEGEEVVERLVRGDRIEKVEVVRARTHEYRPVTTEGVPAPPPPK
jgi:cyclophilin family peptidyl-prolyl cis-trans isomerase